MQHSGLGKKPVASTHATVLGFALVALALLVLAACHLPGRGTVAAPAPHATSVASSTAALSHFWPDWRGPARDGHSEAVPTRLPDVPRIVWHHALTGLGHSGVAATDCEVIVADKSADRTHDVWRCLDAITGNELWTLDYEAGGSMAYSNAPRATPVLRDGLVYLLGAFGQLYCVELATGHVVWHRHLAEDFGAQAPMWGYTATPLVEGDRLIVNPGAPDAALAALDRRTGETLWKSPGRAAAYASFVVADLGGVRQIVGYDTASLGGWDPATGRRLWQLTPPAPGDFNVPSPVIVGERLLAASENNGTRLYDFSRDGRIRPQPLEASDDLKPDMSTPVVVAGRYVVGFGYGLYCLDLKDRLRTVWKFPPDFPPPSEGDTLGDYAALVAGPDRVLVLDGEGRLLLLQVGGTEHCRVASRLQLFADGSQAKVWSHPALVGNLLYVRSRDAVTCFDISGK
jgi:outer membrane protein assembly factor BamB